MRASAHFGYDAQATYVILTPPRPFQDGWNDAQTSENGDKCAWIDMQNITLGGHQFAVQPLWSNEAFDATGNGCVVAR